MVFKTFTGDLISATQLSPPPFFFFMIDYDREFYADYKLYKNMGLKIKVKC